MKQKKLEWRRGSQLYFLGLYITAGFFLYRAVALLPEIGAAAFAYRFPALEGFLPISATVGLKYWLFTGTFDPIHPAGLTILLLAMTSAALFKRGFCSHICPIGTISEFGYKVRQLFWARRVELPRGLVYVLRVPKYLLLGLLLLLVLGGMSVEEIYFFLHSPYNAISEIKMMYFFLDPSVLTIRVVASLVLLSLLVSNFWCRFLCPYGALLSLFSLLSPLAIRRRPEACISCHACERACPNQLAVTSREKVSSVECTLCQNCLTACPRGALDIRGASGRLVKRHMYSSLLLGLFAAGIALAAFSGHWQSELLPLYWAKYAGMADQIFH